MPNLFSQYPMIDFKIHQKTDSFFPAAVIATFLLLALSLIAAPFGNHLSAQERSEPEVRDAPDPRSPYTEGKRNGIGFNLMLNNFGFGVGTEYRRALNSTTDVLLNFEISNLKDESEQTLRGRFGQELIPNKHNRVLMGPVTAGLKQRLFPQTLSDNFRVYVQGSVGITPAFVYPYYDHDLFPNRNYRFPGSATQQAQPPYDVFQGWGDGYWTTGMAGKLKVGVDFGRDFGQLQSVRFGYNFHYFPTEIQIMEPGTPFPDEEGFDAQAFFQSPQITLILGTNW